MTNDVVKALQSFAEAHREIRAMILTSSRARADDTVDWLSDYDVILAVADADAFVRDDSWQYDYDQPLVRWGDQGELYGLTTYFRGVVYEDGVKIDYSVWPEELLGRVSAQDVLPDALDVGYRVLVDKDRRTSQWRPPTYEAHIPARPSEEEYREVVEEFWWGTTYVAKSLWRGELVFAKFILDVDMKLGAMRRVLEWRIEIDHDWSLRPGVYGRGLERWLPADVWSDLALTYVGPDPEENWEALFRTTALFRRVATDVGERLGYVYPAEIDERVTAHLQEVRGRADEEGSRP